MRKSWRHITILAIAWIAVVNASCNKNAESPATPPVPKPVEWPRLPIDVTDSMVDVPGLPVDVKVSSLAQYEVLETYPPGLTVTYPKVNTKIFYTFIPVDNENLNSVVSARQQRISLNLQGAPAKTLYGENEAKEQAMIVVAQSGTVHPVQYLAVKDGYVVTATSFIADPDAAMHYDSISPLYDVLTGDLERTLPGFKFEK